MNPLRQADGPQAQRVPLVVALMGLPGAGKSTIATALVAAFGLRRVCRDTIRQAMFPQCDYSFIEKSAAFRGVLLAVEINGLLGASSVIDGMTFSRREDFERLTELAQQHRFDLLAMFVECSPTLARARIVGDPLRNAHPARDRGPELVDAVAGRFESLPDSVVRIDASLPEADMCSVAVALVAQWLRERPLA
jgi:predicted kinase